MRGKNEEYKCEKCDLSTNRKSKLQGHICILSNKHRDTQNTKNYLNVKFAGKSWRQKALWNDTFTIDTVEEGLSTAWFVPNLSNKRTTWKDIWILRDVFAIRIIWIKTENDCSVVKSAERNQRKDPIWKGTCVFTMGKGLTTVRNATSLSNIQAV